MNIVMISPGAGGMYCGGCFRDNALVGALREQGHSTLMVPLYLPLTLDEPDNSSGTPIFFGGINVFLEQKSSWFGKTPRWLHSWLNSPKLLKLASGFAGKTRAADVGELTLSMIRGEEGNQVRELDELVSWLRSGQRPDVICLSNVLLAGFVRRLKQEFKVPTFCLLGGEDTFLDALPQGLRELTWKTIAERASEIDGFVAPSRYFAGRMCERLKIDPRKMHVLFNGINVQGYEAAPREGPPVVGYFARMCKEKGLDVMADAFVLLKQRDRIPNVRLKIGGGMGPSDRPLADSIKARFEQLGWGDSVEFCPNLDRAAKQAFMRSLSVFSVPALYGEAFGLYLIEALAAGVPIVQPSVAAFPEIVEATGGGILCEPRPEALAEALETLLLDPTRARGLGEAGRMQTSTP
jgi:glycosyltransferase involved in cell wall biosynthesis